jgi:hypothetical protein
MENSCNDPFSVSLCFSPPRHLSSRWLAKPLPRKKSSSAPGDHTRYYDRDHKDYHEWNDRENRSYRVYLTERHHEYHGFNHANQREQRDYWKWRRNHPDHD